MISHANSWLQQLFARMWPHLWELLICIFDGHTNSDTTRSKSFKFWPRKAVCWTIVHRRQAQLIVCTHTYPRSLRVLRGVCRWVWAAQTLWKSFMSSKLISFDFAPGMLHLGWDAGNWFWPQLLSSVGVDVPSKKTHLHTEATNGAHPNIWMARLNYLNLPTAKHSFPSAL